jgi:hypothetical protein
MITERQMVRRLDNIVDHFLINVGDPADLLQRFDRTMAELNQLRAEIAKDDEASKM